MVIFVQNCWDGRLDSPDHTSHVAYSGNSGNGACPKTHPHRLVSLFIERMFSVDDFDRSQAMNSTQPFVFAYGDPTGTAIHLILLCTSVNKTTISTSQVMAIMLIFKTAGTWTYCRR